MTADFKSIAKKHNCYIFSNAEHPRCTAFIIRDNPKDTWLDYTNPKLQPIVHSGELHHILDTRGKVIR